MKKFLALLLTASLASTALFGCGANQVETEEETEEVVTTKEETEEETTEEETEEIISGIRPGSYISYEYYENGTDQVYMADYGLEEIGTLALEMSDETHGIYIEKNNGYPINLQDDTFYYNDRALQITYYYNEDGILVLVEDNIHCLMREGTVEYTLFDDEADEVNGEDEKDFDSLYAELGVTAPTEEKFDVSSIQALTIGSDRITFPTTTADLEALGYTLTLYYGASEELTPNGFVICDAEKGDNKFSVYITPNDGETHYYIDPNVSIISAAADDWDGPIEASLDCGIKVGSSLQEVLDTFGVPNSFGTTYISYRDENLANDRDSLEMSALDILLENGTVTSISLTSGFFRCFKAE